MRAGRSQLDVAESFTPHFRERHFHAALVADDAAMLHPLVLAAQAFPIRYRTENARAEQTISLRLERPVVDGLGFVTSPCDQLRIFSGEARLMRMAAKSAIGLAKSKGLERNKGFLHFQRQFRSRQRL